MNSDDSRHQWHESIGNAAQEEPATAPAVTENQSVKADSAGLRSLSLSKKTVLLVDSNPRTRDSRAKVMRNRGVAVHCVATAGAAHARLASAPCNLVLVDLGRDLEGAEALATEIRAKNPRQLVGFLVGSPLFVATSLNGNRAPRPPAPLPAEAPVRKTNAPAMTGIDFGQRIRDAEAEQAD